MGTATIDGTPKKVVVLTNEATEAVLALGVKPVGAVQSWLGDPWAFSLSYTSSWRILLPMIKSGFRLAIFSIFGAASVPTFSTPFILSLIWSYLSDKWK